MKTLSYGKLRGLQQCAASNGTFAMLALDHRGVMHRTVGNPAEVDGAYAAISGLKGEIVAALGDQISAVLLDPAYGAGPAIASGHLPGSTGLIVTVEETGYAGERHARISRLPEGFGVGKIKRMGASAVKLLVYYHPESTVAEQMQALVREVAAQCDALDVALFLEVLTYSPEPDGQLTGDAKTEAVVGAARDLTPIGGDVYKAEFPVDVHGEPDEAVWAEGCAALSAASAIPWVLLSAGVDHETFVRQTRVACEAGASGILAGRSIWKEAVELEGDARAEFLHKTACKRTAELRAICVELGHPYTDFYAGDEPGVDWYRGYADL